MPEWGQKRAMDTCTLEGMQDDALEGAQDDVLNST